MSGLLRGAAGVADPDRVREERNAKWDNVRLPD